MFGILFLSHERDCCSAQVCFLSLSFLSTWSTYAWHCLTVDAGEWSLWRTRFNSGSWAYLDSRMFQCIWYYVYSYLNDLFNCKKKKNLNFFCILPLRGAELLIINSDFFFLNSSSHGHSWIQFIIQVILKMWDWKLGSILTDSAIYLCLGCSRNSQIVKAT